MVVNPSSSVPTSDTVRTLFDRIAPVYDQLNQRLSLGLHKVWKQMAVDWSQAQPGHVALDLCCGSGDLALLLARRVGPEGHVYGVDFAAAQLAIARQRSQQVWQCPTIDWIESDVLTLPLAPESVDAATMGYGLRNVTDIPACLAEIYRVLKPAARVAILDFHRPQNALMQQWQQWYLDTVVVPAAQQCGLTEEYAYISPSLARFPIGAEQVKLARQAGFRDAVHYAIAGGMMGVLVATR